MKARQLALLAIIFAIIVVTPCYGQYYYGEGQQHQFKVDSLKICIKFESIIGQDDQESIIDSIGRIDSILADEPSVDGFIVCSLTSDNSYYNFLDSVEVVNGVYLVEPYYTTTFDSAMFVGDRFCAAFEPSTSKVVIDSINASFGAVIQYEIEGMPNVFVLLNNPSTGYGILDLANAYYELPETRYAHPLFGVKIEQHAYKLYDYYSNFQPHTKKVIGQFNIASVWDFAGLTQAIKVAVLDDGINNDGIGTSAHEDLPASRVLPGMNFASPQLPPKPGPGQYHGMACAGIIGATHTTDSLFGLDSNSGVISLAPHVQILPVKIFYDNNNSVGVDTLAAAINYAWQNGAQVLSNSWGYRFSTCQSYPIDLVDDAITNAYLFGRGGKGCPVIFSSGDFAQTSAPVRYPGCVPSAFAVGAIELSNDSIWDYSNYDSSLDLVAPSAETDRQGNVWTIDQMGKNGANLPGGVFTCQPGHPAVGDYFCSFGGTSAAAPVVSGVAALILSKDSTLTAQKVYNILDSSAVTQLAWGSLPDTPDVKYGYGRVDAFRAILSISRGDLNNDGTIGNILDLTILVNWIFYGVPPPNFPSPKLGDCNCDGTANNILDLTVLVDRIFRGGPPPKNPCFKF